jgi:hypothetical protein
MIGATIHRVKRPAAMGTGLGNLRFDGAALICCQNASFLGHAGFGFSLADWIGKLPAGLILDPAASIAGKPGAVGDPGEK